MPSNTLIGALRAEATLESGKFVDGARKLQLSARKTESQLKRSFGGMGASIKQFGASLIAGLSVGLIARGVRAALDYAGSLKEVAQQLGVTTKDLQVFRYAAGQVGVSQEQLETGLSKLTITLGRVAAGAKEPAKALAAIGVTADQLKGKNTGEAFRIIADGLQNISDRSQRAAVEVALFGKSGAQLDNLLSGGSTALNELSAAAEKLGIVLSDEQIQKADDTADKLDALQTVISANIAGAVADNADAVLELANAFAELIRTVSEAAGKIAEFYSDAKARAAQFHKDHPILAEILIGKIGKPTQAGKSRQGAIARGRIAGSAGGGSISQFLGGGGGSRRRGGSGDAERKRLQALRDAYQFDQELVRAQMDVLRAQQQLATDYTDRANISIELLNLEQQSFQREMEYAVAAGELTKAQAAQLSAENAKKDALERQAIREEEEAQRLEDYNELDILDLQLRRDELLSQEQLAETASEQRALRLRLLDLDYRIERARLEQVLADQKASWAAKEDARRRLLALDATQPRDRAAVLASTRGPMEDYLASLPTTAAKAQEALESLQVQGFEGLIDAALQLSEGFDSAKDALLDVLKQFLLGLARLELQKLAGSLIPGLPGFASGGFTGFGSPSSIAGIVHGREGVLNPLGMKTLGIPNLDALNRGIPLSSVSNDNDWRRPSMASGDIHNHYHGVTDFDSFRRNERQMGRATRRQLGIK